MAMNYKEVVKRPHDSWSRESKTWFLANSTFGLLHTQNTSQCFAEDLWLKKKIANRLLEKHKQKEHSYIPSFLSSC